MFTVAGYELLLNEVKDIEQSVTHPKPNIDEVHKIEYLILYQKSNTTAIQKITDILPIVKKHHGNGREAFMLTTLYSIAKLQQEEYDTSKLALFIFGSQAL